MKSSTSLTPDGLLYIVFLLIGNVYSVPAFANSLTDHRSSDSNLTCSGQVNVTLQDDCQLAVQVKNVLLGDLTGVDLTQYDLLIKDGLPGNGPVVDGCGIYEYTVTGPDFFSCWGLIRAEDKTPLELVCPDDLSGVYEEDTFYPFLCSDAEVLKISGVAAYTTNGSGELIEIAEELKAILDITGYPVVIENCGAVTVEVKDEVVYPEDPCGEIRIERTFSAVSNSCGAYAAQCTQIIIFGIPGLEEVIQPAETVELACTDEFKLDANGNPHPDETGYPAIESVFDSHDINDAYCNLGASYTDGERIDVCQGTYKVIRTWVVLDWCDPVNLLEFTQLIKVSDTEGPTVVCETVDLDNDGVEDLPTYSSGPYDCTAAFEAPMPVVEDNCSDFTVLTEIISGSTDGPVVATILPGKTRYVSGIPLGCHYFRYTVIDDCDNKTVVYCPFQVQDQVAPVAVCDDDLNISLGGDGYAKVYAKDIDEGSTDNCGPIKIEVRRRILDITMYECLDHFDTDKNGVVLNDEVRLSREFGDPDVDGNVGEVYYYTVWQEFVEFTCCDMNENVRIEMRVWDDRNGNGEPGDTDETDICFNNDEKPLLEDNFNVCWLDVLIEDKVAPTCIPPLPAALDCTELPFDFDPYNEVQMTGLFGTATGSDNCPDVVVEELEPLTGNINDCGSGSFIRRFLVTDAKGLQSDSCEQLITLHQIHDYWIKFPADAEANCGDPMPDTVMVDEGACDLLAISVKDDFFSASGDECYKIFRTYSVINWCEYDGASDPVVVDRDEDCDDIPGDEDVYVIVKTIKESDPCFDYYGVEQGDHYQHVWYDRDSDPQNLEPAAGTKGKECDYQTNPFGFWKELVPITENEEEDTDDYPESYYSSRCDEMASVGYWQYTQVIKVYDTVDPEIHWEAPEPFCSYSSDTGQDCPAEATITFTVEEICTPDDVTVIVYLDAGRDGVIDKEITGLLSGSYPDYSVTGTFPLGEHGLGISVEDGCGNQVGANIPFEIIDCKAPTPICINGLAVELMPVIPATDVNGDGIDDRGAITVWASDFIASPTYDCTGDVTYSINRSIGGTPHPDSTSIILTCSDPASVLIQVWAYDGAGNADRCETYLLVQDNMVQCGAPAGGGMVTGVVAKETTDAVQDVEVNVSGQDFKGVMTDEQGRYTIEELSEGFDYTLTAYKDLQPLNGVSTFDLVLMSKHILGLQYLDSPYKMIAADVNNSKTITTMDAIALRRIVLNVDTHFSNNTSWRFVPTDYSFPEPANPWKTVFPEVINVNNLDGILANRGFVAIKIGDLNGSAIGNVLQPEARSTHGTFSFLLEEQVLAPGEVYPVVFSAKDMAGIQGFQGTVSLDRNAVELVDIEYGLATAENFGLRLIHEGLITTSWHQGAEVLNGKRRLNEEEELFTLILRARSEASLSEVLGFNSRLTEAEAYDENGGLLEVALTFGTTRQSAGFELYQNTPNPFRAETLIGFYLPEEAEVSLRIHDAGGRMLKLFRGNYGAGKQQIGVRRADLPASGVFYYTLTSGTFTATKKMILLE